MKLSLVAMLLLAGLLTVARAQNSADDQYIGIYSLIQQADQLAESGEPGEALAAFTDAQTHLQKFQQQYPSWSPNIISFRMKHVAEEIATLKGRAAAQPAKPIQTPVVTTTIIPVLKQVTGPTEMDNLRSQLQAAQADQERLQAKLKEALAAQPTAVDPRELDRAQEKVRTLMKENDLLKAAQVVTNVQTITNIAVNFVTNTTVRVVTNFSQVLVPDTNALDMLRLDRNAAVKNFNEEHDRALRLDDEVRQLRQTSRVATTTNYVTVQVTNITGRLVNNYVEVPVNVTNVINQLKEIPVIITNFTEVSMTVTNVVTNFKEVTVPVTNIVTQIKEIPVAVTNVTQVEVTNFTEVPVMVTNVINRFTEVPVAVTNFTEVPVMVTNVVTNFTEVSVPVTNIVTQIKEVPVTVTNFTEVPVMVTNEIKHFTEVPVLITNVVTTVLTNTITNFTEVPVAVTNYAALIPIIEENGRLKAELSALRSSAAAAADTSKMAEDLKQSRVQIAALQSAVEAVGVEKLTLERKVKELSTMTNYAAIAKADYESRLRDLVQERNDLIERLDLATKQKTGGKNPELQAQLATLNSEMAGLRSRLAVAEAPPVAYTADELALLKSATPQPANADANKKSIKEMPAGTAELVASAQQHFAQHDYDQAEADYQKILDRDPNNGIALANIATIELQQGKLADAEKNIKAALTQSPDDAYNLSTLGYLKYRQEKYDEALTALSRAAQIDPNNPEIQNYLGVTLSHQGQRKPAEAALRRALQLAPNYAPPHNNLAVIYLSQTPPLAELARWHYQKAVDAGQPRNPDLEKMLADKGAPVAQ